MSTDTTKAMEEALQAAVAKMTKSDGGASPMADPVGLLMSVLPRLLASNEEREDLVEKFDNLEKDTLAPLQEQIRGLRKQVHRVFKMQEDLVEDLRALREQQTAVGNAVLHLAEHMARVQIVDDAPDDYDEPIDDPRLRRSPATDLGRARSTGEQFPQTRKRPRPRRPE